MRISSCSHSVPKSGNSKRDNEDSFWPKTIIDSDGAKFRFSIADGASQSAFASIWARQLARTLCNEMDLASSNMKALQLNWGKVTQRWLKYYWKDKVPWHLEKKVQAGAFATILGVILEESNGSPPCVGEWRALAIGDSCLAHVQNERVERLFPILVSSQFTDSPDLIGTNPEFNAKYLDRIILQRGDLMASDRLYLMTDALAAWFLGENESNGKPWLEFDNIFCGQRHFPDFVEDLRNARKIKNDDTTLVIIKVDE